MNVKAFTEGVRCLVVKPVSCHVQYEAFSSD